MKIDIEGLFFDIVLPLVANTLAILGAIAALLGVVKLYLTWFP